MDTSGFTITLLALILILCLVYLLLRKNYSHWDKLNIPCFPDPMTGFGHFWPIISLKESLATGVQKIYNATSASMIGFYLVQKPCILVRDPELVKSVLVTNFKSFHDNFVTVSKKQDPARSMSPFLTRGYDQWKLARTREVNHLSGQKLRYLFLIVQEIGCKFSAYIERKIEESKDGVFECELRSLFVKFTGEIVANTALSMEGQSFVDNPHKFAFASRASTIFEPTLTNGIKQSLLLYMPIIARLLGIQQISQDTVAYFRENLKAAIKERRQSNIKQNDYLQFCMDGNAEDEIENIVGEIIIYWVDVYETSSASAATLFYFLANNPKVQEKLRNQINDILKETGGAVTYESLKSMNYFDQVLKESLRLIPVLSTFLKVCTEEITLEGSDGLKCNFRWDFLELQC